MENGTASQELPLTEMAALLPKLPMLEEVGRTGVAQFMRDAGCSDGQTRDHLANLARSDDPETGQFGTKRSQATVLVNLASKAELFHTPSGRAIATVRLNGRTETFAVRSADFESYLWRLYYEQYNRAVGSQAVQDALSVLEAKARFDGP